MSSFSGLRALACNAPGTMGVVILQYQPQRLGMIDRDVSMLQTNNIRVIIDVPSYLSDDSSALFRTEDP